LKDPTNRSHPIAVYLVGDISTWCDMYVSYI